MPTCTVRIQHIMGIGSMWCYLPFSSNNVIIILDLEETFMASVAAVEELKYKVEELQMENDALHEKNRQQASHMELLAKENMQLQNAQSAATVEGLHQVALFLP